MNKCRTVTLSLGVAIQSYCWSKPDFGRMSLGTKPFGVRRAAGDLKARPAILEWLQDHMIDEGISNLRLWRVFRAEILRFDRQDLPNARIRHLIDRASVASCKTIIRVLGSGRSNELRRRHRPAIPANPTHLAARATPVEMMSGLITLP